MQIEDFFIDFLHLTTKLRTGVFDFLAEFVELSVHLSTNLFDFIANFGVHFGDSVFPEFEPLIYPTLQLIQRITKSLGSSVVFCHILIYFS